MHTTRLTDSTGNSFVSQVRPGIKIDEEKNTKLQNIKMTKENSYLASLPLCSPPFLKLCCATVGKKFKKAFLSCQA